MKKFFNEFKTFISRGNVIDMAVGIVVGSAFTAIINSFVADIITPVISLIIGNISFEDLKVVFKEATEDGAAEVALRYGNLIQAVINFLLIAFALFVFVKIVNGVKAKAEKEINEKKEKENAEKLAAEKAAAEAAAAAQAAEAERLAAIPTKEEALLMEIRDLLKAQSK